MAVTVTGDDSTTHAGQTIRLVIGAEGGINEQGFVFDNIQVNPVPVPTMAWLFGSAFGGIGVMRRRSS